MSNQNEMEKYLTLVVNKIKTERKSRNISQLKLAHILGHSSPNYIAKIETRAKGANYNLKHLFIISIDFSIPIQDLLPPFYTKGSDNGNT